MESIGLRNYINKKVISQ